ncbi:hypothetical protein HYX02_02950 [Candidatus Woesearchaeota archaeon]|nr:hypothetical protein [Candidatus Woesearchaeota archaeon]
MEEIEHTYSISGPTGEIKVTLGTYPIKTPFHLHIPTEISFAEAIELFKRLGLPELSSVKSLYYGTTILRRLNDSIIDAVENRETEHPYSRFGDIELDLISIINSHEGDVEFIATAPKGTDLDGVGFTYKSIAIDKPEEGGLQREIVYTDVRLHKPRLEEILKVSSFEISPEEQKNLIGWIKRTLRLT